MKISVEAISVKKEQYQEYTSANSYETVDGLEGSLSIRVVGDRVGIFAYLDAHQMASIDKISRQLQQELIQVLNKIEGELNNIN
ncbi:hypothetical protein [Oceanobacillus sp. FSL H7-0719]|uniref:hypothetical protein n=1 Tax=Oceanobacillus sp. FSL H7-0719 TaxID=2954507 RepID=UPI003245AD17